jgi:peptidoglycan hydrolase-like protein with peptidoglycan-binding domain
MALTSPRFASNQRLQQASENSPPLKAPESGDAVCILQMALIDLGYDMPVTTAGGTALPDGIFGAETTQTVRAFQMDNGLDADGVAGRHTLATLEALTVAASEQEVAVESVQAQQRSALS